MKDVAHNLKRVQERMAEAALRAGRDPAGVTLVAVTKTRLAEEVVAAHLDEGAGPRLMNFGDRWACAQIVPETLFQR